MSEQTQARTSPQSQHQGFIAAPSALQAGCPDLRPCPALPWRPQGTRTQLSVALRAPSAGQPTGEQGSRSPRALHRAMATRPTEPPMRAGARQHPSALPGAKWAPRVQADQTRAQPRLSVTLGHRNCCPCTMPQPAALGDLDVSHGASGNGTSARGDARATALGNKDRRQAANWTDSLILLTPRTPCARCPPQKLAAACPCLGPLRGRGWAVWEGWGQGTPVRLCDPWDGRRRRVQEML